MDNNIFCTDHPGILKVDRRISCVVSPDPERSDLTTFDTKFWNKKYFVCKKKVLDFLFVTYIEITSLSCLVASFSIPLAA